MKLDTNNHSVFLLYYHLVLVAKYRRKVIDNNISNRLNENIKEIYIVPKNPIGFSHGSFRVLGGID